MAQPSDRAPPRAYREDLAAYHSAQEDESLLPDRPRTQANLRGLAVWVARALSTIPARQLCQDRIRDYWTEVKDRKNQHETWKGDREAHFRKMRKRPEWRDPDHPVANWQWDDDGIKLRPGKRPNLIPLAGWVPPQLLGTQEPIDDGPLPLSIPEPLGLAGSYTVLALIYDENIKDAGLCPWTLDNDPEAYRWFRRQKKRVAQLTDQDVPTLEAIFAQVEEDLQRRGLLGDDSNAVQMRTSIHAAPPKKYLKNWREILDALDMKNHDENRRFVAEMNRQYDGPITPPSRGGQPKVEKTKLIEWWNHLEVQWDTQGGGGNTEASVQSQYKYGRTETVVPDISGHVKRRRGT